jgi:phytoene synthase
MSPNATYSALAEYVYGSACVIGLQILPVLGTEAATAAAALGEGFQLTNFLRDVGEDLERGRLYLPAQELSVHGVDRELELSRRPGPADRRIRRALAGAVARTRAIPAGGHRDPLAA